MPIKCPPKQWVKTPSGKLHTPKATQSLATSAEIFSDKNSIIIVHINLSFSLWDLFKTDLQLKMWAMWHYLQHQIRLAKNQDKEIQMEFSLRVCWKTLSSNHTNSIIEVFNALKKNIALFECVPSKSLCWKLNPQCNSAAVRFWEGKVSGETMPSWMDSLMILQKGLCGLAILWHEAYPSFVLLPPILCGHKKKDSAGSGKTAQC